MLGDGRVDGGHDDILVVVLVDVIDRLEPEDTGRHVAKDSDHASSLEGRGPRRQAAPAVKESSVS